MRRVVAAVAVLGTLTAACRRNAGPAAEAGASEPLSVSVEVARLQTLRATVAGSGLVMPAPTGDWTIYAPEAGRIAELPKAEGDAVKPGDLLARFEYGSLTADINAREGDLAAAGTRLEAAQAQLARVAAMVDRGFAARNDLENARNAVASAELDIARLKQQLQAAQAAAEQATIKARFAGIIAKKFHNEGDLVSAALTDPVLRVVDPTRLQVAVNVPVEALAQVQVGQMATIISANGVEPGSVALRPTPEDPQAAMQEIRVAFAAPTLLALEAPVQVEILIAERPNVIALPNAAILRSSDGAPYVMIAADDGRARRREVRPGFAGRDRTEIIAGLAAGERVIVKDPASIIEGTPVIADR